MAAHVARKTRDFVFRQGKAILEATQHTDFILTTNRMLISATERGGEVEHALCKQLFEFAHAQEMRVLPSSYANMEEYLNDPQNAQDHAICLRNVSIHMYVNDLRLV